MARVYESSGARPWGRFDNGYPNAGDTRVLTLSAAEINGQVTLLEHFGGGETQRISAYKAGLIGDVWVGGAGDKWTRRGTVDYGHGFLTGNSGSLMITANENFDSFGAACDSIGLISDSLGFRALSGALSAVDIARSWNSVGIAFATGAPRREKLNALGSLTTDFVSIIFPPLDVLDLYTNVRTGIHIDRVP
jgi:hypothetical protein